MKKFYILLIVAFVLQLAARAEAISLELSCNIKTDGSACDNSGVYTLRGVGFANVNGVTVDVSYDTTTLKNPEITPGPMLPSAMTNTNYGPSSLLRITGFSSTPLAGTDILATYKFAVVGATPGTVSISYSKLTTTTYAVKIQNVTEKNPNDFIQDQAKIVAINACNDYCNKYGTLVESCVGLTTCSGGGSNTGGSTGGSSTGGNSTGGSSTGGSSTGGSNTGGSNTGGDSNTGGSNSGGSNSGGSNSGGSSTGGSSTGGSSTGGSSTGGSSTGGSSTGGSNTGGSNSKSSQESAQTKVDSTVQAWQQAQANAAGASVTVVGGASIGTITLPPDQMASTDRKTEYQPLVTDLRGDMTIPVSGGGSAAQTAAVEQPAKKSSQDNKSVSYKSVLQLFREFNGEKSPKALISLFAEGAVPNFSQVPPVALSDGITPVRLTLTLRQGGTETPKFMLQGASVQQMSSEGEEQVVWTIDALPKKGVYDARLTVIDGQNIMEFPLVVAPSIGPLVPKAQKFTEADFTLYLSNPAKFDLNKDEKFDSLDDYIFTANYIVALKVKPEKLKKDEPKPVEKGEVKGKEAQKTKEENMKKVPSP